MAIILFFTGDHIWIRYQRQQQQPRESQVSHFRARHARDALSSPTEQNWRKKVLEIAIPPFPLFNGLITSGAPTDARNYFRTFRRAVPAALYKLYGKKYMQSLKNIVYYKALLSHS